MPIQLLGPRNAYEGLSTDLKPSDASVPIGSTFDELDTGHKATWNGSAWNRQASWATLADAQLQTNVFLAAMLNELVATRQLSEVVNELEVDDLDIGVPVSS